VIESPAVISAASNVTSANSVAVTAVPSVTVAVHVPPAPALIVADKFATFPFVVLVNTRVVPAAADVVNPVRVPE